MFIMSTRILTPRFLRPRLRIHAHARLATLSAHRKLLSTLPNIAIFRALQKHDPSSLAVLHSASTRSFTYGNLIGDVLRAKDDIERKASGKLAGERIAFLAENSYDYVVTLLAILASDAIALPLSPSFPVGELQYIMDNSQAKVLLATEKYADKASQVLKAGLEFDPLFDVRRKIEVGAVAEFVQLDSREQTSSGMMLYTSGTTNRPVGTTSLFAYTATKE